MCHDVTVIGLQLRLLCYARTPSVRFVVTTNARKNRTDVVQALKRLHIDHHAVKTAGSRLTKFFDINSIDDIFYF